MTNATVTIVINATKESAEAIRDEIDAQSGSESYITERRNLDGDAATWILIANLAVQALPHVLTLIKERLPARRGVTITIKNEDGEIVIENASPADLKRYSPLIDAKLKAEKTNE